MLKSLEFRYVLIGEVFTSSEIRYRKLKESIASVIRDEDDSEPIYHQFYPDSIVLVPSIAKGNQSSPSTT